MKKIIYRNDFGEIFFFRRDSDAEEEKLRMLTDSGLQRVSDVHFKLSPDAPKRQLLNGSVHIGDAPTVFSADRKHGEYSLLSGRNPHRTEL